MYGTFNKKTNIELFMCKRRLCTNDKCSSLYCILSTDRQHKNRRQIQQPEGILWRENLKAPTSVVAGAVLDFRLTS